MYRVVTSLMLFLTLVPAPYALFPASAQDEAALLATISVQPQARANVVNVQSRGAMRVAILCSAVIFPADIDPTSITLGPGQAIPRACQIQDLNQDGCDDMVCTFAVQDVGVGCDDTILTLSGVFSDGNTFTGTDVMTTLPCRQAIDAAEIRP